MGSRRSAATASPVGFSPGSARIQRTTPRSKSCRPSRICNLIVFLPSRMLAAGLKPLARRPCPRCLIIKDQIPESGSKRDTRRRGRTCADSEAIQTAISKVRTLVFKGTSLSGNSVLSHIKDESIYPVCVSVGILASPSYQLTCF